MAAPVFTRDPDRIVQGASVDWLVYDGEFAPEDGWVEKWVIVNALEQHVVVAQDNGDGGHLFSVSTASSTAWKAGTYKWRRVATDGTDVHEMASGDIVIEPSFLSATGGLDARTDWEVIHEDLVVAYKEFVSGNGARTSFSIAGRLTTYSTAEEFIKAINSAKHEVWKERQIKNRREGKSAGNSIQTRMS